MPHGRMDKLMVKLDICHLDIIIQHTQEII